MSTFFQRVGQDLEKAKKSFDSYLSNIDGDTQAKQLKEEQEKAVAKISEQLMANLSKDGLSQEQLSAFQKELDQALNALKEQCFESGFSEGYYQGVLTGSSEFE